MSEGAYFELMRRFAFLIPLVLLVPAGVAAAKPQAIVDSRTSTTASTVTTTTTQATPSDGSGSLAVSGATGTLVVRGRGVIFGYFDQGSLLVLSYKPDNGSDVLSVEGATAKTAPGVTTYTGTGVRFLLPAGEYILEVVGSGFDISAVGKGNVGVSSPAAPASAGSGETPVAGGTVAVDGGAPEPFDHVASPFTFGNKGP
jgi:hypothetical protein